MRLKRIEEEGKAGGKGKDGGKESWEPREKFPCKFFMSDGGCKKGRECRYLHEIKDEKRRCYTCGSIDHIAPNCPRSRWSEGGANRSKVAKVEGEEPSTNAPKEVTSPQEEGEQGAVMKNLLEEANKMLKSLTSEQPAPGGGVVSGSLSRATTKSVGEERREEVMDRLQKQLDELRVKTLRISRMAKSERRGLLDSGATHALRPMRDGENKEELMNVRVTLADGELVDLKMNQMGTMVVDRLDVEPIVPMGALIKQLGCRILWHGEQVKVEHVGFGPDSGARRFEEGSEGERAELRGGDQLDEWPCGVTPSPSRFAGLCQEEVGRNSWGVEEPPWESASSEEVVEGRAGSPLVCWKG